MSNLLEQLNLEMGQVVENARRSLVEVRNGRGGSGAGTIWHPEGLIITSAHVIRTRSPQVVLPNRTIRPARVLAYDSHNDVAALTVDTSGLPTIQLGESPGTCGPDSG